MATLSDLRDDILGLVYPAVTTDLSGVAVTFDNDPFDWNNTPEIFSHMEIQFYGGDQIGMSATPRTRHSGFVYVTTYIRSGAGRKRALDVNEWFASKLGYARAGAARLQAPRHHSPDPRGGYHVEELRVPFYADDA